MSALWTSAREDILLIITAATGGLALHLASVPAGWLTGAMLLVALVSLRKPWSGPSSPVVQTGMLLSGIIIGSAATPEAVAAMSRYPGSIALLFVSMAVTVLVTGAILIRFGRWTRLDALLASAPGALSAVMAVAQETKSDMPKIAIIQFFRLFVLVAAVPSLLVIGGSGAAANLAQPVLPSWLDTGLMLAAGLALGLAFLRMGVVAPMVLGSTMSSMLLHALDLVHGSLPPPLSIFAFVILGGMIGSKLGGLDRATIGKLLPLAVVAFVASVAVAAVFAWPAAYLAGVSYGAAFVAFAPGGLEAMAMLAIVLGFDPLYVGAHHLLRFVGVGLMLPIAVRWAAPPSSQVHQNKNAI
ncbi:MAG: AbrB family transcriptional regulator [Bosea sp. (in: a-proteobacteria)]